MILKKETKEKLSRKLSLPYEGTEQDWDIEMANPNRINDFLKFYQKDDLSLDESIAVMSLILASYEDFLNANDLEVDDRWEMIKSMLESKKSIFAGLINYWALWKEIETNSLFKITPLLRNIKLE